MAPIPTVQTGSGTEKRSSRPLGGGERRSELVTRVKYCNTLPDLPFDTKFISYPFASNRFVNYSTTSLERNYIYDVLTEADLGVDVELVIPNAYNLPSNAPTPQLDQGDERLLEDDAMPQKDQKRSRHHTKSVSWLRRTEYISTEQTRFQPQSIDKVEAKVGYSVKKMLKDDITSYMDREAQVKSIEKTFEDSQKPIESHFAKPGVVPTDILPVFPDFRLWKYPCAQVIFDSDPAPAGKNAPVQIQEMSQAMIRGVMDESGEQFVAYFLPTEETMAKRKKDHEAEREYEDDQVYEYRMAREYNWNVKSKATKGYEENYFFVIRDEGVYYNELETRVRLNKRRMRTKPDSQLQTKLCVKHIPLSANEYKFQSKREKELEPLLEEDEEEEEEEAEVEAKSEKSDDDESDDEVKGTKKVKKSKSDSDDDDNDDDVKKKRAGKVSDKSDSEDEKKRSGASSPASSKSGSDDEGGGGGGNKSPKSDRSAGSRKSGGSGGKSGSGSSGSDSGSDSGKSSDGSDSEDK